MNIEKVIITGTHRIYKKTLDSSIRCVVLSVVSFFGQNCQHETARSCQKMWSTLFSHQNFQSKAVCGRTSRTSGHRHRFVLRRPIRTAFLLSGPMICVCLIERSPWLSCGSPSSSNWCILASAPCEYLRSTVLPCSVCSYSADSGRHRDDTIPE